MPWRYGNRMKWRAGFRPMGRAATASILSLAMALGITACSNDYTVSYVYMVTSKTTPEGLINGYQVDYQSGLLRPLADSPISSGGRDTVGIVVAPNDLFLYTVNNFDSDVVEFGIGTDGKLYPWNTYNTTGSLPTAGAIDAAGKTLLLSFQFSTVKPSVFIVALSFTFYVVARVVGPSITARNRRRALVNATS